MIWSRWTFRSPDPSRNVQRDTGSAPPPPTINICEQCLDAVTEAETWPVGGRPHCKPCARIKRKRRTR